MMWPMPDDGFSWAGAARGLDGVTDVCNALRVAADDVPDRFASIVAELQQPDPARRVLPSRLALATWLLAMVVLWAGLSVLLVRLV